MSIILATDLYKVSHYKGYPARMTNMYSYLEMGSKAEFPFAVFGGLQYLLRKYLEQPITTADIDYADDHYREAFGSRKVFNRKGWEHILRVHGGRLPLSIRAVPEGSVIPTPNIVAEVSVTDSFVPWLGNYIESLLLKVHATTTTATISYICRQIIAEALEKSGTPKDILTKLVGFEYRGCTSEESSEMQGLGHLFSFSTTDNSPAIRAARRYYGELDAGGSIPAMEHSTVTAFGRSGEAEAYQQFMDAYPQLPVSIVSDSYDIYAACRDIYGGVLREQIMKRLVPLVIRPDSGQPIPVMLKCLDILCDKFPTTINAKGYRMLPPYLRMIQGDRVTVRTLPGMLDAFHAAGWSSDNFVFGMGGGLINNTRETLKFRFKASQVTFPGEVRDIAKSPVTELGKASRSGRLQLNYLPGAHTWEQAATVPYTDGGQLMPECAGYDTLHAIRERLRHVGSAPWKEFYEKA